MVKLEPFTDKDFKRLISWFDNRESLVLFAGTLFEYPLTKEQLQEYVENKQRKVFRVKEAENGTIIGHAETLKVSSNQIRLCRILVGEKKYRGKGYGSKIISELLKMAFDVPEVDTVDLNVYDHNFPAIKCYKNAGFKMNPAGYRKMTVGKQEWLSLNMVMERPFFLQSGGNH